MFLNQKGEIMFRGLLLLLLLTSPLLHAGEVYRWLDERGNVYYSDQPPPPSAKQTVKVRGKGNVVDVDKESYEARIARERNPVVLYASACGPICDQARDHLNQRGIPFTTKDPSKEPEIAMELKKLVGVMEVPVITVGKTHQKGFDPSSWDSLLDAAGYPKTPLIPTNRKPIKNP
jgi:glutaredoxin